MFRGVAIEADVPDRFTVAHEVGHLFGLPHRASGLMHAIDGTEQAKPFLAEDLRDLREYQEP